MAHKQFFVPFLKGISAILDTIGVSCCRLLLSGNRFPCCNLYDSTGRVCRAQRAMVVWECLPRGNFYDRVLAKYSPHKPIPAFVRTKGFRIFMVMFIFTMFGIQMYRAWGDWNDMGRVFWTIILITTIVGVTLSFIYAPRTWCSFCPMGTLSAWVSPRSGRLPDSYRRIIVGEKCTTKCKLCSAVCPMQLKPYESRNDGNGFLHPDCIKCGRCIKGCPLKVPEMKP